MEQRHHLMQARYGGAWGNDGCGCTEPPDASEMRGHVDAAARSHPMQARCGGRVRQCKRGDDDDDAHDGKWVVSCTTMWTLVSAVLMKQRCDDTKPCSSMSFLKAPYDDRLLRQRQEVQKNGGEVVFV
jgi:hypothetical protein